MNTFLDSKKNVLDFIDKVNSEINTQKEEDAFRNSTDYKLRKLDKCRDEAKNICLDKIFAKIYNNAIPLNDEYKVAHSEDIDACFNDFIQSRCPNGIEYYVKEALRKGSPFAKKVLEAVDELVNNEYHDKAMNIEDQKPEDLDFDANDESIIKKLDDISDKLSGPEISEFIKDNVKATALAEITRAKREKESLKELETQLANDVNLRTEESVRTVIDKLGLDDTRDYAPTLFSSVVINKMNKLTPAYESGKLQTVEIQNALSDYGKNTDGFATVEELAFIEAVEEYTCLSVLKALKFESFNKYDIKDLTESYSQKRF